MDTKKSTIAYLLWLPPFGILGFHRMYLGHWFMGVVYLFTLGYAGIGWIVDGVLLPQMVRETNSWLEHCASHPDEVNRHAGCDRWKYGSLYYRSLRDAYILTLSPFGLLGLQHAYLGRHWYRLAYSVTAGLFGIGWLTDMFRMPSLVKQTNDEINQLRSGVSLSALHRSDISDCNTLQAYLFAIPGFLGFHHFYLGRWKFGITYFFTLGLCGLGWLCDFLRMPYLVERSNQERKMFTQNTKHVDDAYLLAFPLGLLGAHHFYLNRPCWGILYLCTLGLFGLGWLIDLFRMSSLVREANLRNKQSETITLPGHPTYAIPGNANVYVFSANQHNLPQNTSYPNLPPNTSYPTAPPPHYNVNAQYPEGYQTQQYPQTYTEAVPNQYQEQQLKRYPPP